MNSLADWKKEYRSLRDFISAHPEIVVNKSEISIPQDLRDEFYRHFDDIRRAAVRDSYSALPSEIGLLCDRFIQIEKEIISLLHLERISMPLDLYSFLHNPEEGLIRALYNTTFDLIQGKIAADEFENRAGETIRASSAFFYRLGYEWWAALTIIGLLDPDEAYRVDFDDDYQPILAEMKEICFGRQAHHPTKRIPEFVIHSRKVEQYVAIKMALARELQTFLVSVKPPVRPRKKTGDTSLALDSRVMLLSFMESKEKIPILADIYECTLTHPHWMIECVTGEELGDPNVMDEIKHHSASLKPRLGTCLLLVDPADEADPGAVPEGIRPLAAGFDKYKLLAAVDELAMNA
jgi:hypothetical protein